MPRLSVSGAEVIMNKADVVSVLSVFLQYLHSDFFLRNSLLGILNNMQKFDSP